MKGRSWLIVWLVALMAPAAIALLLIIGTPMEQTGKLPRGDVVAIGSSLMFYALPNQPRDGFLGDMRSSQVLAISSIREDTALRLLRAAIANKAETVFLEVNPFVFDFRLPAEYYGHTPAATWTRMLDRVSQKLRTGLADRLGLRKGALFPNEMSLAEQLLLKKPTRFKRRFDGVIDRPEQYYPVNVRSPRQLSALRRTVAQAIRRGATVVLVVPPRSQTAMDLMGEDNAHALAQQIDSLAEELDLPVFSPGPNWSDEFFRDRAHLNTYGRDRFISALRDWWSQRP